MPDAKSIAIPARVKDLTGKRFGRLDVLRYAGSTGNGALWLCLCNCGATRIASGKSLIKGSTQKCKACHGLKHGMHKSPEYGVWACMLNRCNSSNYRQWAIYGGRGITVCKRWQSFEAFYEDMGPRPSVRHTLDRFPNNDGNYEPGNCRWATMAEQNRNKGDTHVLTLNGKSQCIVDWAEEIGITVGGLHGRLRRGWTVERALTAPVRRWYRRTPTRSCRPE
jgi:hypothetical protein